MGGGITRPHDWEEGERMSGAPTGWQTPRTTWQAADAVSSADLNRAEGNSQAIELGDRTVDQAQTPSGHVGTLRQFLSWIVNRLKAITGATNWYSAPATTLAATKTHLDSTANPHSVTKTQVGLGSVDNVQQAPLSDLQGLQTRFVMNY